MTSPYECPRHRVALVARTMARATLTDLLKKRDRVSYFACPVTGCDFVKPNKWKRRKMYERNA